MSDDRKGLPPANSPSFMLRVREILMTYLGQQGDISKRGITVGDLVDAGVVRLREGIVQGTASGAARPGGYAGTVVQPAYEDDRTPPPMPVNFTASTSTVNIQFQVGAPTYRQGHGHAKTVIYGVPYSTGPLPTFSNAVKLTEFTGTVFAIPIDPAATYRLWATWVSVDGVESAPAGGVNGISATTGLIDDAKIASLGVSKLLAGAVAVGQYIQSADYVAGVSGWRIATLTGGDGFMEVRGNAIFGGTVYATAGELGGNSINASGMQSPGYVAGSTGWRLDSTGVIRSYSGAGANQFDLAATGTTPILKVGNVFQILGNGTFNMTGGTFRSTAGSGKRIDINETTADEMTIYGDRGDAVIDVLATLGIRAVGTDYVIIKSGSTSPGYSRQAIVGESNTNNGVTGRSVSGNGVEGLNTATVLGTGAAVLGFSTGPNPAIKGTNTGGGLAGNFSGDVKVDGSVETTGNIKASGDVSIPSGRLGAGVATSTSTFVATGASTAAVSSLRIPHGVAPTTPVDGDIWTTTTGMFVRINGLTYTLAGS